MDAPVEHAIDCIASHQYGLITRAQAVNAGATPDSIDRLSRKGTWTRVAPAVYRMPGASPSWLQDVMLATLSVDERAAASHQTAAILWQLIDANPYPIHVATTRSRWRPRQFVLHRSTDLADPHVTRLFDIPVTTPTRTVLDMAATVPPWTAEQALDSALRRGLTSIERLVQILEDLGRQGRRGVKVVRELVDVRKEWSGTTESELEDGFRRLLHRSGLPTPQSQHDVSDGTEFIGRVDFAYPDQKIAIELDGYAFHSDPAVFVRDRERQNRLLIAGYRVLRYTAKDLRERPDQLIDELRAALSVPVNRSRAERG